jgi:hypothetical protein
MLEPAVPTYTLQILSRPVQVQSEISSFMRPKNPSEYVEKVEDSNIEIKIESNFHALGKRTRKPRKQVDEQAEGNLKQTKRVKTDNEVKTETLPVVNTSGSSQPDLQTKA